MPIYNKIVLIHPGTQYSHQLAKQLHRKKILLKFITGFSLSGDSIFSRLVLLLFPNTYKKLSNRVINGVPTSKLIAFPFHEFIFLRKLKHSTNSENVFLERNLQFQKLISSSNYKNANVIIGFDTSSWFVIQECKKMRTPFILDVSIAHSKSKNVIYNKISHFYPNWSHALEIKSDKFIELEQYELMNASHIVVASEFTKNTLVKNGVLKNNISINPYGIDLDLFPLKKEFQLKEKINFIFTGLIDARKGIPFLIEVLEKLDNRKINLSLVGSIEKKNETLIASSKISSNINVYGKIQHKELPKLYSSHDVFIFPSYFEGFGLVILEAMASGLPVITTTATAGPDIIDDGVEGFIIEPGNESQLKVAIQFFVDNPDQIELMGKAARKKAEQYTWDAYGDRWEQIIEQVICK